MSNSEDVDNALEQALVSFGESVAEGLKKATKGNTTSNSVTSKSAGQGRVGNWEVSLVSPGSVNEGK